MPVVRITRTQLAYTSGNPQPLRLTAGEVVDVPADLAESLLAGGDAEPVGSDGETDAGRTTPINPAARRGRR